jgi:hypothetical protein
MDPLSCHPRGQWTDQKRSDCVGSVLVVGGSEGFRVALLVPVESEVHRGESSKQQWRMWWVGHLFEWTFRR